MHLDFGTGLHLLLLWDGVGHHHSLKGGVVDARNGRPRENAVCEDGVDLYRASVDQPGGGVLRRKPRLRDFFPSLNSGELAAGADVWQH